MSGTQPNPLGMRQIEPDGPFVLSPVLCSERRKEYFHRANRILATYCSLAAYAHFGKEALESTANQKQLSDTNPIRINMSDYVMQTTYRQLRKSHSRAGAQLTNQIFLMIYGNFDAYLFDLVRDALSDLAVQDPIQEAVSMLASMRWAGKIDRLSNKLSVKLPKRKLLQKYKDIEMGFLGKASKNPIDFLQSMANLRHRLVHSAGRADPKLIQEYPNSGLKEGDLIELPFGLPYSINFFFVPFTDVLDESFCDQYSWRREMIAPENLVD
jgi:hypothetical protein